MGLEELTFYKDWQKKRILGQGSFGRIELWQNRKTQEFVAIKKCHILPNQLEAHIKAKLQERWKSEIDFMKKNQNEYLVKLIKIEPVDFIEEFKNPKYNSLGLEVMAMEYCDGGDLRAQICKVENCNGLKEIEIRNILRCLRNAVEFLHNSSITHRDLKPENIVIQLKNGSKIYKLTDLGYAKTIIDTCQASVVGTSAYLAPEIMSTSYSHRVDYWSLGIIAFEIICGIRPFLPHQVFVTQITNIKKKTSDDIAITENNSGTFEFHQELFNENQVSEPFKLDMEKWLKLALECSAKQRGSIYIKSTDVSQPPILQFQFYSQLNSAINSKILNFFCLSNYKFFSFPVTESMSLNEFQDTLQKLTKIPKKELFIIFPIEHNIEKLTENVLPVQLYAESIEPMLFVTRFNYICSEFPDPHVSPVIGDIISISECLKLFTLKDFSRKVLYFLRKQQKYYETFTKGLKTYALQINHLIVKKEQCSKQICLKKYQMEEKFKLHKILVSESIKGLEEKNLLLPNLESIEQWKTTCKSRQQSLLKICNVADVALERFSSLLRRSTAEINSNFFKNICSEDFFKVKIGEHLYTEVQALGKNYKNRKLELEQKIMQYKRSFEDLVYSCIRTRTDLLQPNILQSKMVEALHKNIIDYHKEFYAISNVFSELDSVLDKNNFEINKAAIQHQKELCSIYGNISQPNGENVNKNKNNQNENISLELLGSTNFTITNKINNSMEISCFGESNDCRSLIDEHEQIQSALNDLLIELPSFLENLSMS